MSDAELNPTLRRQLRRLQLCEEHPPATPAEWHRFLDRISQAYANNRQDLYLMERSVHMVSQEMQELYTQVQRRADYRVASERDRLRAIISGFSDAFASMDLDGRILTLNPAGEIMLGEGACGHSLLELLTFGDSVAEELTDQVTMCTRVLGGQTIRDEGATILAGSGRRIPVSVLVFPIRQRGEVTSLGATIRDIGERLQAERTLRRLGMAVDASADAIYTTDTDGTIEYVNAAFTTITGFRPDEAIGQNPRMLSSGRTSPEVYRGMWAQLLAGKAWTGRILNRRKVRIRRGEDRYEEYWAQLTITGYFDAGGVLQGYVALQRDVSEIVRREHRQAAEAFATRLRAETAAELQRQSPLSERLAAVVTLVAESLGEHSGAPAGGFLRLYGSRSAGHFTTRRAMPQRWRHHVRWPGDDGYTPQLHVVDSPDVRADLHGAGLLLIPVTHARLVVGCLVVATQAELRLDPTVADSCEMIGEMVGLAVAEESAWRAAEDARSAALAAAEAKSKFLANMSHEIRTPMNGVLGMLDMLRHTELDAKQQDYLAVAHTSAEALLTVINDILDFSKIEAGKVFLEEIPFDVRSLAEDVTTLFSASAIGKGIELACYVPGDVPAGVRGDPTRLRQVLANIIGNAVKFTDAGEIVVRVTLAPDQPRDEARSALRFEVRDTGIGMDNTTIAHLFQPFSQADSSMSRRFGGTGLGLAISHQLVELMGGHIRVSSESGQGTTFWFDVPFPRQPEVESRMGRVESLSGARVLVVDDNETNRTILAHYLRDWDLSLDTAADGVQALEMMRAAAAAGTPYRVAMVDMQMPRIDGATLARRIRALPELARTRLVLVTSAGISDELLRAQGFDYSISKPVRQAVVHDILLEMGGRAPIPRPRTAPVADLGGADAGRILLAEDNLVNQRVALGMLEVLGIECDVATDGRQTLARLAEGDYSLVLMDCQMPVMDGFEATRRLRRMPGPASVPVIAMTAHAMDGDREACLAAGMDDYLPKPFTLQQLSRVLARWLPQGTRRAERSDVKPGDLAVVDAATLDSLADVMGDALPELVAVFLNEAPELLVRIRTALDSDDAEDRRRAAHSLRSSAKVFGARPLADRAQDLEGQEDVVACRRLLAEAEDAFAAVARQLRPHTGEVALDRRGL